MADLTQAIENEEGQIGIKRDQPRPYYLPGERVPSGKAYVWTIRANISFSWVEKEDVEAVLKTLGGCCGGKKKIFALANVDDARRWTNGGGR